MGQIHYSSPPNPSGLELDHYELIITDITNHTVYEQSLSNYSHTASVGSIFNNSLCSPYSVILQAYNMFGHSETVIQVGKNKMDQLEGEFMHILYKCDQSNMVI